MTMRSRQSIRARLAEAVNERNQLMKLLCAVVLRDGAIGLSAAHVAAADGLTLRAEPNEARNEVTLTVVSIGGANASRVM